MSPFYFKRRKKQASLLECSRLFEDNVKLGFHHRDETLQPCHPLPMSVLPDLEINLEPDDLPAIPLPKGWSELTLQAVLHVITLARIVIINAANK